MKKTTVILAAVAAAVAALLSGCSGGHKAVAPTAASTSKTLIASRLETLRAVRLIDSTTGVIADRALPMEAIEPFLPGRWLVRYPRPSGISGTYCMLIDPIRYHATHSHSGYEYVPCEIRP